MDTFFVLQGVRKIYYILSGRILDVYAYTFEMSLVSVVLLRSCLLQPTSSYFWEVFDKDDFIWLLDNFMQLPMKVLEEFISKFYSHGLYLVIFLVVDQKNSL